MTEENQLTTADDASYLMEVVKSSEDLSLALMFNEKLYTRCRALALTMSNAQGITPKHLIGKPETCFAVVTRSILWKLDPFSVAGSTYDVNGKHGYEGKLCRAILEKSGRFEGRLRFEKIPSAEAWQRVQGKVKMATGKSGGEYAKADYTKADEEGLGVAIHYHLKGEDEASVFEFYLNQAHPRNSTLWATDPWTQLCYLASRRFANSEVPDIFMGVPFDKENVDMDTMQDVTPQKPTARRQADDINQILQKTKDTKEPEQPKKKEPEQKADDGKGGDEKSPDTKDRPIENPAKKKADQIITDIKTCKNGDEAQEIFDKELDHIFMLPQDLQDPIHDLMDSFKQ